MKTRRAASGFSLVEVVLALGLVTFVLVAMIGLFTIGLSGTRESEQNIGAANLAAEIVNKWIASPTNSPLPLAGGEVFPLSVAPANVTAATPAFQTYSSPVGSGGYRTDGGIDSYKLTYACWRDQSSGVTGHKLVKVHLILTSPYDAPLTNATTRYEVQASCLP